MKKEVKEVYRALLYCVEIPGTKLRWFPSKKDALFFAETLYNQKIHFIDESPIYEHQIELTAKGISDFLNIKEA